MISPWSAVSPTVFATFGLATFTILFMGYLGIGRSLYLIFAHFFIYLSTAVLIYKIGFGFDPFIHKASMEMIDKIGKIEPKTIYYAGQYSLIIIIHKLTAIPIHILNTLLVPLAASLLIPLSLLSFSSELPGHRGSRLMAAVLALIVPLPLFIMTVPQNLSYLALLFIVFTSFRKEIKGNPLILLVAVAALFIHPLSGIPAVLFAVAANMERIVPFLGDKAKRTIYCGLLTLNALIVPASFIALGRGVFLPSINNLRGSLDLSIINLPQDHDIILNFVYFIGFNLPLLITALIIIGFIIARKEKIRGLGAYFGFAATSFAAFLIMRYFMSFDSLINYEQGDYGRRMLFVGLIFLAPFIFVSLNKLACVISESGRKFPALSLLVFLSAVISASFYLTYPRLDNYHNSHGYSVGKYDIEAVRIIDRESEGDHIVLCNQQVSAAALDEFGFSVTEHYPIPTGVKMYGYYLDMVKKEANKKTMAKAMAEAGASQGFFVLNDYWWASDKILKEAKMEAENWWELGDGKVYVFEY
jgi:hypothetical protein